MATTSSIKYIRTTALARVTSTGSGGRASILKAIKPVADLGHLTNKLFSSMNVGDYVEVSILIKPGRRTITGARSLGSSVRISEWVVANNAALTAEEERYNSRFSVIKVSTGAESVEIPLGPAPTPAPAPTPTPVETASTFKLNVPRGAMMLADAFYLPEDVTNAFFAAKAISGKIPAKVLFTGPSGYGKTSSAQAWAAHNGYGFVRVNTALINDREEAFYYRTVDNASVEYIPTALTRGLTTPKTVVVLDELNRTSPEMLNAIFPILDDSARTEIFGREIVVAEDVIIVATINEGYAFSGTFSIDGALRNRFDVTIIVSALPSDIEEKIIMMRTGLDSGNARKIVELVNGIRGANSQERVAVDASTRTSLRMAKIMATTNLDMRAVFEMTILNGASQEDRKELLDMFSLISRR